MKKLAKSHIFFYLLFVLVILIVPKFSFATSSTFYWVGGSGNWSDSNHWSTSSGGTSGAVMTNDGTENVAFDSNSSPSNTAYTVTIDNAFLVKNFTMDGPGSGNKVDLEGDGNAGHSLTIYGNFDLVGGTAGIIDNYRGDLYFDGYDSSSSISITTNGVPIPNNWIGFMSDTAGNPNFQLQDDLVFSGNFFELDNGTINTNNHNLTTGTFLGGFIGKNGLNLGSSVWTLKGDDTSNGINVLWDVSAATDLTFNAGTSTIIIADTGTGQKTFNGGNLKYNNVTFSGDNILVIGNNTFNTINVNNAGLTTGLFFTNGSTQTVSNFTTNGSSGNLSIIASDSSGTPFIFSKPSGTISADYMSLTDSTVAGGATWYAGANSIGAIGAGNSGWIFTAPPLTTISATVIAGVTPPATGAVPITTVVSGTGYTGTVSWSGSPTTFAGSTIYTATITLSATTGYTLTGVTSNQFTIADSTSTTNSVDSGVITAVFPTTSSMVHLSSGQYIVPVVIAQITDNDITSGSTNMLCPNGNAIESNCTQPFQSIVSTLGSIKTITNNLYFGMRNPAIRILQQFLILQNKGSAAKALGVHGTTLNFRSLTRSALAEWQRNEGISPAVGYFGPVTRAYIKTGSF